MELDGQVKRCSDGVFGFAYPFVLEGGCVDGNEACRGGFGDGAGDVCLSGSWGAVEEGSV